jgi:hypothetical protein
MAAEYLPETYCVYCTGIPSVDTRHTVNVLLPVPHLVRRFFRLHKYKEPNCTFVLPRGGGGIVIDFFLNNQPDALTILIYSIIKLYRFRAPSLPIVRSFLLYCKFHACFDDSAVTCRHCKDIYRYKRLLLLY